MPSEFPGLDQLRDIHLPDPVSWWPPAPGWWLLCLFVLLAVPGWRHWRRRRSTHYRRWLAARAELAAVRQRYQQSSDARSLVRELSIWLRRTAMSFESRRVAGLTGEAWLRYLDESLKVRAFHRGAGRIFMTVPYQRTSIVDADKLLALCGRWLLSRRSGRKKAR